MPNEPRGYSPPAPAAKPWQTGGAVAGAKPWQAGASSAGAKPWQTGAAHETPKSWQAGATSTSLNPRTSPPPPAYNAAQNGATTTSQQSVAGSGSRFRSPSDVHVHLAPSISGTIAATAAAAATSHAVNNFSAGVNSLQAQAAHKGPPPPVPKRLGLRTAVALYDYDAQQEGDLSFRKDDRIEIVERTADVNGWWTGKLNGRQGAFPGMCGSSLMLVGVTNSPGLTTVSCSFSFSFFFFFSFSSSFPYPFACVHISFAE